MNAEKALPGYFGVLKGRRLPNFMLLRKVACKRGGTLGAMWAEHGKAMRRFDGLKKGGRLKALLSSDAEYSLLDLKHDIARKTLSSCVFCERRCGADRVAGRLGWCRVGANSRVCSMFAHVGEESFLVPSGTVFFSGCTWACAYCQNWDISQFPERGVEMDGERIAGWLDSEARAGRIKNANFVGGEPTPNLHTILDTMRYLKSAMPIIWNSNMYMSEEAIGLLDGAADAYLADFRYGNDRCAMELSKAPKCMATMARNFKAIRGRADLIVRILVIPSHVECDAIPIIDWLSDNMPDNVYVNLMSQYFPHWKARQMKGIDHPLGGDEFSMAAKHLQSSKIRCYEIQ